MAQGCDLYFAEAVLALRELHPDVTLEAAIPCATQADRWPAVDRERYVELLARCDEQHLIQQAYSPGCMQRRNQYMVDHSALLLAAFAGLPGGTMNTILYAQRSGVETVVIGISKSELGNPISDFSYFSSQACSPAISSTMSIAPAASSSPSAA